MSVNSELSALLTKMGGTPLESDSNSDLIKKISSAYEGGGSGAGCITIIHGTFNDETEVSTLDMKAGELYELCKSGVVITRIGTVTSILMESDHTELEYVFNVGNTNFAADTADDYPTSTGDGK